jgi:hypothetical protein
MIPTFLDLITGKTAKGDDSSLFWWSEGNGACDCNRVIQFDESVVDEMDAQMRKDHPDMLPHQSFCYGCKRFVAIDVEGDLEGNTKEQVLAGLNSEYASRPGLRSNEQVDKLLTALGLQPGIFRSRMVIYNWLRDGNYKESPGRE